MKTNQNVNEKAFFALLKAGLFSVHDSWLTVRKINDVDWREVYRLAEEQSVVGVVSAGIDWFKVHDSRFTIPQEWALQFIGTTLQLEQQNAAMNKFVASLVEKMRNAGIYALLAKGQGVAQCYEKPLWRSCGDVDFFLSEDNFRKAKTFLIPMASTVDQERGTHLGMTIDGWVVELHGSLHCGLSSRIDKVMDEIFSDCFYNGNIRSWMNGRTQIFMLSVENDVLFVFTHFLKHFYKEGLGLRQICDWCRLLYTYRDKLDLHVLESRIRQMGLMSEWKAFYTLATKYLGMPDVVQGSRLSVQGSSSEAAKPSAKWERKGDRIIEFVLNVGNMGYNRGSWLMEHDSWFSRQFVVRKAFSMFRRIGDLINHACIFPLDSLRFLPKIMFDGLRFAVRGEG